MARDVGELAPRARAALRRARRCRRDASPLEPRPPPSTRCSRRRSTASGSPTRTRSRCCASRDLVAVGRVANEIRSRMTDPSTVTFIIDRNLNYTNVCVTDCDFCAFYRAPGRRARGLPAAEAGDLQEDRGDARDRRHRPPHAGRPPSRPRRSTTTRISSARSRRATRSTSTRSRRRRSSTSRGARS